VPFLRLWRRLQVSRLTNLFTVLLEIELAPAVTILSLRGPRLLAADEINILLLLLLVRVTGRPGVEHAASFVAFDGQLHYKFITLLLYD